MRLWPFRRRDFIGPIRCPWVCPRCHKRESYGFLERKPTRDGASCNWCDGHDEVRRGEDRRRQEELAALVAGRLAPHMSGYRDDRSDPHVTAAEAMRIARAIMESKAPP